MKSNISNGINTSKLPWEYMITLKNLKPTSMKQWEEQMLSIMIENEFNQIFWGCERDYSRNKAYHTHLLIDSNNLITDLDLINFFMSYLINGRQISYKSKYTSNLTIDTVKEIDGKKILFNSNTNQNNRVIEYKKTRTLVDQYGNRIVTDYIDKELVPFHEIVGKNGSCYIEKIKGVRNIALYVSKFTNSYPTTGYMNKRSLTT
jgi:hypothetical protein